MKLDRAKVHLDAIHTYATEFIKGDLGDNLRISSPDPENRDWQDLYWEGVVLPHERLGAMLGDFIHNVRSALDQLIWALVLANDEVPGAHTQFPATESEGKWRDDVTERDVRRGPPPTQGLSADAFKLIEDYQSFRRVPRPKDRVRYTLHLVKLLSNEDKHRTLHAAAAYRSRGLRIWFAEPSSITIKGIKYQPEGTAIKDGAKAARVRVGGMWPPPDNRDVHMKFEQGFDIGFYSGDRFMCTVGDLMPMLSEARQVWVRAMVLPEML